KPAMLEQMHGDHALGAAIRAGHIAKVPEHSRRVIALVYASETQAPEQQSVSSRGVDNEAREPEGSHLVGAERGYSGAPLRSELDVNDSCVFEHGCSELTAVVEQQLVEIGAPNVITVIDAEIRVLVEAEDGRVGVLV